VSKLSTRGKLGVIGGGALLVLLIGWFAVVSPKRSEASKIQVQIEDAQTQLDTARAARVQQHGPVIHVADLFRLSRAMPNRADIPNVLLQLSDIAADTGISFESITPHDPVSMGGYMQLGIDLVFEGHFYDLSDFLYRLRNLVSVHDGVLQATGRLFTVDSVSFDEGHLQFPQVKATLTVSAYVYGDGTAAPIPPEALAAGPGATTSTTPTTSTIPTTPTTEDAQPIPAAPAGSSAAGA
jgi:type II secretory pathway component PulM